jgi:hypothetical protein
MKRLLLLANCSDRFGHVLHDCFLGQLWRALPDAVNNLKAGFALGD